MIKHRNSYWDTDEHKFKSWNAKNASYFEFDSFEFVSDFVSSDSFGLEKS